MEFFDDIIDNRLHDLVCLGTVGLRILHEFFPCFAVCLCIEILKYYQSFCDCIVDCILMEYIFSFDVIILR